MEDKYIIEYYNRYDEENRLERKHQKIEFLTTVKYVEQYLKEGNRILEVGAGTGRYSLYFARKNYQVDSLELVKHNIDIFKSKLIKDDTVTINQGNALNLDMYQDNTFDVTLVLGPMYHMYNDNDKHKVIEEALRVTKKGGYVFIAYITHDSVIVNWGLQGGQLAVGQKDNRFTDDYRCISDPKDLFAMMNIDEFKELIKEHNIETIKSIASDGVAPWFRNIFENIKEEEYNEWLKYHFQTCERQDLIGFSNHILYIGKKV